MRSGVTSTFVECVAERFCDRLVGDVLEELAHGDHLDVRDGLERLVGRAGAATAAADQAELERTAFRRMGEALDGQRAEGDATGGGAQEAAAAEGGRSSGRHGWNGRHFSDMEEGARERFAKADRRIGQIRERREFTPKIVSDLTSRELDPLFRPGISASSAASSSPIVSRVSSPMFERRKVLPLACRSRRR